MDADTRRLLTGNYEALLAGLRACKTAKTIGDISAAIGAVARKYDLGIVRELCGHGTGYSVHEEPFVENDGRAGTGPKIVQGMMLAIEPIFTLGKPDIMELDDGWNIVTCDGSIASQYEHNVYFSAQGPVIVTHWGVPEWYKSESQKP